MFKIASESYLKHNINIEIKILENDNKDNFMKNYGEMFRDITKKILYYHFVEKKNILYVESDTICFKKLNFDNINKLLMFNLGTGKCDLFDQNIMMNSGIIYLPNNCIMNHNNVINMFNNYSFDQWINFEKFWNILYYAQFSNYQESIEYNKNFGKYNYFKTNYIPNQFINNVRSKEYFMNNKPSIVHICGSRGSRECLKIMNILKDLNIEENSEIIYETLPIL
jgi:hypothetical protein